MQTILSSHPLSASLTRDNLIAEPKTMAGIARQFALQQTVLMTNLAPATVSFESLGLALVVGGTQQIMAFAASLSTEQQQHLYLLATDGEHVSDSAVSNRLFFASQVKIKGYLGRFEVLVLQGGEWQNFAQAAARRPFFDVIIDLSSEQIHPAICPPLGYYALLTTPAKHDQTQAINALDDLKGTFDKPKFFRLDLEKCAHFSRGLTGCTRCLDVCATDALSVVDDKIQIDPYLCQGLGSCTTACPTEALSYTLPEANQLQSYLYQLIEHYQAKGGENPIILFYGKQDEADVLAHLQHRQENIFPIALEEVASVGIETWFCALVYGASQVGLVLSANVDVKTRALIEREITIAQALLTGLNLSSLHIATVDIDTIAKQTFELSCLNVHKQKIAGSKREVLAAALDMLARPLNNKPQTTALPYGSPYGRINIKADNCTLCMGCVAVCPTHALQAIGVSPGLTYREQDCVQCGLCASACPESVISLTTGYNWDEQSRQTRRVLHQEPAAECVRCGKAFAPLSMVEMLKKKLANHQHFQASAFERLSMCEDCRVKDVFSDLIANPDKQLDV